MTGQNLETLVTGLVIPTGIDLDLKNSPNKMYWSDDNTGKIQRANLALNPTVEDLITGLDAPWSLVLDLSNSPNRIYYVNGQPAFEPGGTGVKISRANLDGSSTEDIITGLLNYTGQIDLETTNPTLVDMVSFSATLSRNGGVLIQWTTASEIDNVGFNIWRSGDEDGKYVQINLRRIPAEGSSFSGARYDYVDDEVNMGETYYYQLESVDYNGISEFFGPVSTTALMAWGAAKAQSTTYVMDGIDESTVDNILFMIVPAVFFLMGWKILKGRQKG